MYPHLQTQEDMEGGAFKEEKVSFFFVVPCLQVVKSRCLAYSLNTLSISQTRRSQEHVQYRCTFLHLHAHVHVHVHVHAHVHVRVYVYYSTSRWCDVLKL